MKAGIFKKYEDWFVAAFFLLVTVVYSTQIPMIKRTKISPVSSAFMPTVVAVGMGILTLCQVWQAYKKMKQAAVVTEEALTGEEAPDYKRAGLTIGSALLYVLALKPVGFVFSTIIYLVAQMSIMAPPEKRKPLQFLLISVIVTAVVYVIFHNVLRLMLPAGILSGIM